MSENANANEAGIVTVGVVGLGTMGSGIIEVVARHGYCVIGVDVSVDGVERARERIEGSMARGLAKGKLTQDQINETNAGLTLTTDIGELAQCDLVIEAITEDLEAKRVIFQQLDALLPAHAILATNTSALSVTDISVSTERPSRVVGLHFFNPATVQRFVEVIQTVTTDPAVVAAAVAFVESLEKEPVVVGDRAGFIANALLFGYLNQAVTMYEQKYASREDIDAAMKLGCGLPMGPLALLDLIGLDTSLQILDTMYRQSRNRLHAPAALLKHMVSAGLLGRKSAHGFYTYEGANTPVVIPDSLTPKPDDASATIAIKKVAVFGSGTMATGIVSVFATAGIPVTAVTRSPEKSAKVVADLTKSWDKLVSKGKIDQERADNYRANVSTAEDAKQVEADLVIEAIAEDLELKLELFRSIDSQFGPEVIFATTTSSLPVIELAAATSRPERFLGIHFFNPAPVMKLVEIVSTVVTDPDVISSSTQLITQVGKTPVQCSDRAGFIVNALLFPYLNNAITMAAQNYASQDDIDRAMKLGCGYPMGPFELLDVVGLDVSLAIINTLLREFREPGFAPDPQLEHLVTAGYLGRKVGRGFRTFE